MSESVRSGSVVVNAGKVIVASGGNLGSSDGSPAQGTTVNAPGSLEYLGSTPFAEDLFLNGNGSLALVIGTVTPTAVTGSVTLLSTSGVKSVNASVEFQQPIAGPGGLIVQDFTSVILNAPARGSFATLEFSGMPGGSLKTEAADQLSQSLVASLPVNATLDLNGHPTDLAGLNGSGVVALGNTPSLLTITNATQQVFMGTISGAGGVTKAGAGEEFEEASFSTIVSPSIDQPLVVERTMRWDATGYGAHTEKATNGPQVRWYFAEGSQGYFSTFVLLANPQTEASLATVKYFREDGQTITRTYDLPPQSRRTIAAGDDPELADRSFGFTVDFSLPGVAERSMYFGSNPLWEGGHESADVNAPSPTWYFAEGATGAGFDTFILVTNPATLTRTIPGNSRLTINPEVENLGLPEGPLATQVSGFYQVIAERSQYWTMGAPSCSDRSRRPGAPRAFSSSLQVRPRTRPLPNIAATVRASCSRSCSLLLLLLLAKSC